MPPLGQVWSHSSTIATWPCNRKRLGLGAVCLEVVAGPMKDVRLDFEIVAKRLRKSPHPSAVLLPPAIPAVIWIGFVCPVDQHHELRTACHDPPDRNPVPQGRSVGARLRRMQSWLVKVQFRNRSLFGRLRRCRCSAYRESPMRAALAFAIRGNVLRHARLIQKLPSCTPKVR